MLTKLTGITSETIIGPDLPTVMIGERINPTGRKIFSAELQAGDLSRVAKDAELQAESGATVLDINVGAIGVDEIDLLPKAIQIAQEAVDLPICIDSSNPDALRAGLEVVKGRALVNSVNGEEEHLNAILPIVAEYDAAVIALCMDDDGIPTVPEKRLEIAEKILERAAKLGIKQEDVVIDPLVLTIGADHTALKTTLKTARLIREKLGNNMTAGASNASHGMPDRELLNTVFISGLIQAGINAPICNPRKNGLSIRATDLMLGRDKWSMTYIKTYRTSQKITKRIAERKKQKQAAQ